MRLGILTQYYPPEVGAPQTRLSELARQFREQGHEVVVLTAMPNYPTGRIHPGYEGLWREEVRDGVRVIRSYVYPTKRVNMVPRLLNYFSFMLSSLLVGLFRMPKVDFLLTESPPLFLGLTGVILSRVKGGRLVFNVSDLWPESAIHMGLVRTGILLNLAWKLERFCYEKAWMVSCQSREILQNIQGRFPDLRTHYLSNGVDTRVFRPEQRSAELRGDLLGGRKVAAVYAGLHGVAQGLDQVLGAADLVRDLDDLAIVFVGDGPEKERLQNRARELGLKNVSFRDPCPHSRMPSLIASADIALVVLKGHLPGAVPSKIYEAMGSGIAVMLAAHGEAAGIVEATRCGYVVTPGDSREIAEGLRKLVLEAERRRDMGRQGRRAALACFDRQRIARGFIEALEDGLAKGAPVPEPAKTARYWPRFARWRSARTRMS